MNQKMQNSKKRRLPPSKMNPLDRPKLSWHDIPLPPPSLSFIKKITFVEHQRHLVLKLPATDTEKPGGYVE